jgi:hypothetical protein
MDKALRGFARNVQGSGGLAPYGSAGRVGSLLSNELPACRVLPWRGSKECERLTDPELELPSAVTTCERGREGSRSVAAVMIGIDPHKGWHTAVAIDAAEQLLGMPPCWTANKFLTREPLICSGSARICPAHALIIFPRRHRGAFGGTPRTTWSANRRSKKLHELRAPLRNRTVDLLLTIS